MNRSKPSGRCHVLLCACICAVIAPRLLKHWRKIHIDPRVVAVFPFKENYVARFLRSALGRATCTHSPLSPATGIGVATTPSRRKATSHAISEASEFFD